MITARYDAAGTGRRLKGWNPPSTGPARVVAGTERIRNRARDSVRNDWAGESSVQKWTTSLVGIGVTPRWADDDINAAWAAWVPECDADGVLNAYALQALAVRSWFASGEVFLRRRPRSLLIPLSAPVQVQLIESEYCPLLDTSAWPGMGLGNTIRQGVERNNYGRRVAYWMYKEHPGENVLGSPSAADLIRIPASEISHVYEPKRAGQLRGVSELANVLVRIRSSVDFEDAVLDRQKLANLFVAFLKRPAPPDTADIDYDPLTGLPMYYDSKGNPLAGLEPGLMQELQPGEDVTFANPPEAGTGYTDYMRTNGLGTAAGGGLPYELMSGDIKDISDRSLRVVINEFRRFAEQRQWHVVIPMICQPMVDWWAEAMVLAGMPVRRLVELKTPEHQPHGWEYIHPVQDVEGKVKAIDAGLTSKSAVIAQRGDNPKKVFYQRAADQKTERDLGIETAAKPTPGPVPADPQPNALSTIHAALPAMVAAMRPAKSDVEATDRLVEFFARSADQAAEREQRAAEREERAAARLERLLAVLAGRDLIVENSVNVPAAEPPTVKVEVQPTITVAAPEVRVTNVVQPATVELTLPPRESTTTVHRDETTGQIEKSVTTEITIQ